MVETMNDTLTTRFDTLETSFGKLEEAVGGIDERLKSMELHGRITTAVLQNLKITSQNERLAEGDTFVFPLKSVCFLSIPL